MRGRTGLDLHQDRRGGCFALSFVACTAVAPAAACRSARLRPERADLAPQPAAYSDHRPGDNRQCANLLPINVHCLLLPRSRTRP